MIGRYPHLPGSLSVLLRSLFVIASLARLVAAQTPDTPRRVPGATVSGVVRDSIARAPLVAALVQLVAADTDSRFGRTVVADSLGMFTIADVPDGHYLLGFFHPMLDSIGVAPPLRAVHVAGLRPVRADLAIPSPARMTRAFCGPRSVSMLGSVVVGVVRDARDGAPAAGATVRGEWLEFSVNRTGLVPRTAHVDAVSGDNGWFAMCDVPNPGTLTLLASRGPDGTGSIEVQVPAEGFLRRELYVGPARTIVTGDTTARADAHAPPPRRLHVGDGRLSGTVVSAAAGQPVAGAQVGITDGPQTRANERGEWTLGGAPAGTRMLDVRAVGFYPERRRVDVVAGAPPVHVALSTFQAVLDTVKVTGNRRHITDRNTFKERKRTGAGRYLTAEDIAKRQPTMTSDLFKVMPGVRLEVDSNGFETRILMRGPVADWCSPSIYIDGLYMADLDAHEIDTFLRPGDIAGIEVYNGPGVPVDYEQGRDGFTRGGAPRETCGSILIWRK